MTTAILAIDPGKVKLGVCFGLASAATPSLVQTFNYAGLAGPRTEGYLLATRVAAELVDLLLAHALDLQALGAHHLVLCMERMQVDARTAGKEADLLDVALTGSAVAALATQSLGFSSADIWSPTPMEWKKQLPKKISHERTIRDLDLQGATKLGHDALDAAAIWLWCQRQLPLPLPFRRANEARVL